MGFTYTLLKNFENFDVNVRIFNPNNEIIGLFAKILHFLLICSKVH
jgi:hypothetical protein